MPTIDRVICFDLFHTLIMPSAGAGASYEDVFVRLGVERSLVYPFVRSRLMTVSRSVEEMVAELFSEFGLSREDQPDDFDIAVAAWSTDNDCRWMEGSLEILAELRASESTAVCLVSNVTRPAWRTVDAKLSIAGQFRGLHLSWEQEIAKPDPRCWERLLGRLDAGHVPPSRCWMIGDNQNDDLAPPARMGWKTFLAAKDGSNLGVLRERLLENP